MSIVRLKHVLPLSLPPLQLWCKFLPLVNIDVRFLPLSLSTNIFRCGLFLATAKAGRFRLTGDETWWGIVIDAAKDRVSRLRFVAPWAWRTDRASCSWGGSSYLTRSVVFSSLWRSVTSISHAKYYWQGSFHYFSSADHMLEVTDTILYFPQGD